MEGKARREIEQRLSKRSLIGVKYTRYLELKDIEQQMKKWRRMESVMGITNLAIPRLWIRDRKGTKHKGYPLWITFV